MINGKSYVIAPKQLPDMEAVKLNNGAYLNWYSPLHVAVSKDKRFVLVGDCWSVKKDEVPSDYISKTDSLSADDILKRENYWCGRYILILDHSVYPDASGTMSVFYNDSYASNSLNLLRELMGLKLKNEKLRDGLSPDFVPGTQTQYDGIKRLLPSMVYDLKTKAVTLRTLLPEFPCDFPAEEDRIKAFVDEFAQGLKNLDEFYKGKTKLIACTGGRDSRCVTAVSEYAGLRYDAFTLEHDTISSADIDIPVRMTEALGRKHYYLKKDKSRFSKDRLRDFDLHLCNYEKGPDRVFFGCGQFEELKEKAENDIVLLRGSVWEVASDFYGKEIGSYSSDIASLFPLIRSNSRYEASINEWVQFAENDRQNQYLKKIDRIYWDLREGCWLATIEHAFDLYDGIISAQPLNCRRLITLLLGFDAEERRKKLHEEKITQAACPALGKIPYDYQIKSPAASSALHTYGQYAKKAGWLLFNYGPGSVLTFIKNKA